MTTKTKDDEEEATDTAATCEEAAGKNVSIIVFTMFLLNLCWAPCCFTDFFEMQVGSGLCFWLCFCLLPFFYQIGLSTNWDMADVIAEPGFLILIFLSTIAI